MSNWGAVLLLGGGAPPAQPGTPKHQEGRVQLSVHPSQAVPYSLEDTRGAPCCIGPPPVTSQPEGTDPAGPFLLQAESWRQELGGKEPFY